MGPGWVGTFKVLAGGYSSSTPILTTRRPSLGRRGSSRSPGASVKKGIYPVVPPFNSPPILRNEFLRIVKRREGHGVYDDEEPLNIRDMSGP